MVREGGDFDFAVSGKGKHKVYPYERTKTSIRRRIKS
jgi:hypothetical protein